MCVREDHVSAVKLVQVQGVTWMPGDTSLCSVMRKLGPSALHNGTTSPDDLRVPSTQLTAFRLMSKLLTPSTGSVPVRIQHGQEGPCSAPGAPPTLGPR